MVPSANDVEWLMRRARTLAIDLPDERDRAKAIKWLKLLQSSEEESENDTKRHVINLLLICLQRKRFVGPFLDPPIEGKQLTQYSWECQPDDIARLILQSEFDKIGKPPIMIEFSGDLCEYVATQAIPQFGAHFFYAYSPEEVKTWDNLDKAVIPKGYLSLTVAESPETSILALTVEQAAKEKKLFRHKGTPRRRKRDQFVDISVIEESGQLKKSFTTDMPASKIIHTQLLQEAIEEGIIQRSDIAPESSFMLDKGGARITEPHVETVTIAKGRTSIDKRKKFKNITTKKQKVYTEKAFQDIAEEYEEEKGDTEKETKQEAMLAKMPARLRQRLTKRFVPREQREFPGRDPKLVRTPEIFRKGAKRPFRKYRPDEFGLDKDEPFYPPEDVFQNLEYEPPQTGRKAPQKRREPKELQVLKDVDAPLQLSSVRIQKSPEQQEVEASWDRSYKKMISQRIEKPPTTRRPTLSPRRKDALDRLNKLKAAQPRRLVFDDMDVQIEPEERKFERFVYTEFPDEDDVTKPSILGDDEMDVEDVFGEDQIGNISLLPAPTSVTELERAEILLDTEMQTDDIFGDEQVEDPNIVFKEVTVQGDRFVAEYDETPRRGGLRLGRRVLNLPGIEPMEQAFVEQFGDVVFDESLKEVEPEAYTPPMNESILNQYLDAKLKRLRPGDAPPPRLYGPWAEAFRRDVEKLERGEELTDSFPEDAAKFVYQRPPADQSFLSDSEMETSDVFGKGHTAIPSPLQLAEARKLTAAYNPLKKRYETAKKKRRDEAEPEESPVDQDLLEPYVYESLPADRRGLLDFSIEDEGLEQALIRIPTPRKRDPLESFEKHMDSSLKYYTAGSSIDEYTRPRLIYDEEFLNRRIADMPAENSIIEHDEMDVDDIFGEDEVVEPIPVRQIPDPYRSTPRRPPPARHSPLYQEPYRLKMEEILPSGYLDEESFPMEASELASGLAEAFVPPEKGENEVDEEFQTAQEFFHYGDTYNILGDDQALTPSRMQKITPTKAALIKSVKQSIDTHILLNKYRQNRGLRTEPDLKLPVAGIQALVEAQENLLSPILNRSIREPLPGLLDESILEEGLDPALVGLPKKPDPFADYEAQIINEIMDDREPEFMSADLSIIEANQIEDDMFGAEMIAEPAAMKDIPMPLRVASTPKCPEYSNTYFMIKRPSFSVPQRIQQSPIPEEQLEDFSVPEMASGIEGISEPFEMDDDDREIVKQIFDGEIPPDFEYEMKYPKFQEGPGNHVDSREISDVLRRAARLRQRHQTKSTFDAGILGEDELVTDDLFGQDSVVSPGHFRKSPTKMILEQSVRATKNLQGLKNRLRALRNLSQIKQIVPAPFLQEDEEQFLDPIARPFLPSSKRKDPFESFEREMDDSMRKRQKPRTDSQKNSSFMSELEMSDMFGDDQIAEPAHTKTIPMPKPKASPFRTLGYSKTPRRPVSYTYDPTSSLKTPPRGPQLYPPEDIEHESFPSFEHDESGRPAPDDIEHKSFPSFEHDELVRSFEEQPVSVHDRAEEPSGPSFYDTADLVVDDIFGPHVVTPPQWKRTHPANLLLERTAQQSKQVLDLRNRFRRFRGMSPLADDIQMDHLRELAAQEAALEKFADRVSSPYRPRPLDRDPFESFERDMDANCMQHTDLSGAGRPSGERSVLSEGEMADIFGDDMIAEPAHMRTIPMPAPKASPFRTPGYSQTPPARPVHLQPLKTPPRGPQLYTPEDIQNESFPFEYDSYHSAPPHGFQLISIHEDTIPKASPFRRLDYSQTPPSRTVHLQPPSLLKTPPREPQLYSPEDIQNKHFTFESDSYHPAPPHESQLRSIHEKSIARSDLEDEAPPSFINYSDEHSYPFDLLSPIEFRPFPDRSNILDNSIESGGETPLIRPPGPRDYLQFDDSIGPVPIQPLRSTAITANQFRILPDAIPDERLDWVSPPRYSQTPATPQRAASERYAPRRLFSQGANEEISRISPRRSAPQRTPKRISTPYQGTPRRSMDRRTPRQLFPSLPPGRKPLEERFQEIATGRHSPKIEFAAAPRREFSPTQFVVRALPPIDDMLDLEEFPNVPVEELFDVPLGPFAYACYIPTEQEEREIEEAEQRRRARPSSPQFQVAIPPPRPPPAPDASPIGRTDVQPHEEGFKWLDNYMPYEQQVGGRKGKPGFKPTPMPTQGRRRRSRLSPQPIGKPRIKTSKSSITAGPSQQRGATSEFEVVKTKTPSKQTLLTKSTITRVTAPPRPKLQGTVIPEEPCTNRTKFRPPLVDKKTITKRLVVGEVGSDKAVMKRSSIQIQKDKNRPGSLMIKKNVMRTKEPGKVKKSELKFAMKTTKGKPPPQAER